MILLGCSWLASLAALSDSSSTSSLSGVMSSVSTRAIVTAPAFSRSSLSFLLTAVVLVAGRSTIICAALPRKRVGVLPCGAGSPPTCGGVPPTHHCVLDGRRRGSRPPPFAPGPAQHFERRFRTPGAGLVRVGLAVRCPVFEDGIEDLPSQFDLLTYRKQGWLAGQHVEDELFVGL